MVTKDEDYRVLRPPVFGLQVLWLRIGNVPNRMLFARLAAEWPRVERELVDGRELVEVER